MKKLDTHITDLLGGELTGKWPSSVSAVTDDSRQVTEGAIFVAVKGPVSDGHNYIPHALENGASVIVSERKISLPEGKALLTVKNSRRALALLAGWFYDYPSEKLKLTGITGTNGKTSVTTMLYTLFRNAGYASGLISTIENRINDKVIPAKNTTPGIVELNRLLSQMVNEGVEYAFMEVSSHGIHQERIEGIRFDGGVFTNLTHEHLDYHGTFIEYRDTKKKFFDRLPRNAFALTNIDDKNGRFMLQNTPARAHTYGLKNPADFKTEILEMDFTGMLLKINGKEVWVKLTGRFNAYNLTAVFGTAVLLGIPQDEALVRMSNLQSPPGRFERVMAGDGRIAIIDYAHTPDALENVLHTINEIKKKTQQVITVVGAGGDRDKTKRPLMADVAARLSDWVILTSDNPRTENPADILADMLQGVPVTENYKTLVIEDRSQAIKAATHYAKAGDIILIAGKGHENYQVIGNEKKYFSDKEEVIKNFNP